MPALFFSVWLMFQPCFFSVWIIWLCQGYTVGVFLIVFVMDVLLVLYTWLCFLNSCSVTVYTVFLQWMVCHCIHCVFEQLFCHCIHCVFAMDGLSLYTLCFCSGWSVTVHTVFLQWMVCHCTHCVIAMDGLSLYTLCNTLRVPARLGVM